MLLSRDERSYDFGGACFDLGCDRAELGRIIGMLLNHTVVSMRAASRCLSTPGPKDAHEIRSYSADLSRHLKVYLQVLEGLGANPGASADGASNALTVAPMRSFSELCLLDFILAGTLELVVVEGLCATLPASQARTLLAALARQKERHIAFGEDRLQHAVAETPGLPAYLLGLAMLWLRAVRKRGQAMQRSFASHPVLGQADAFVARIGALNDLQLRRVGIVPVSAFSFPAGERMLLMTSSAGRIAGRAFLAAARTTLLPARDVHASLSGHASHSGGADPFQSVR